MTTSVHDLQLTLVQDILDLRSTLICKTDKLLSLLGSQGFGVDVPGPIAHQSEAQPTRFSVTTREYLAPGQLLGPLSTRKPFQESGNQGSVDNYGSSVTIEQPSVLKSKPSVLTKSSTIIKSSKSNLGGRSEAMPHHMPQALYASGSVKIKRTRSLRVDRPSDFRLSPLQVPVIIEANSTATSTHNSESQLSHSRSRSSRPNDEPELIIPLNRLGSIRKQVSDETSFKYSRNSVPSPAIQVTSVDEHEIRTWSTVVDTKASFAKSGVNAGSGYGNAPTEIKEREMVTRSPSGSEFSSWRPIAAPEQGYLVNKNKMLSNASIQKYSSKFSLVSMQSKATRNQEQSLLSNEARTYSLRRPQSVILNQFPLAMRLSFFYLLPIYDNKGRYLDLANFEASIFGAIQFSTNGLHPKAEFSMLWDSFMIISYLSFLFLVPIVIGFNINEQELYNFQITISIIYVFDSILTSMTPQSAITTSTATFQEYESARPTLPEWLTHWSKRYLIIDIISLIPFRYFTDSRYCELLDLLRLVRMYRIPAMMKRCPSVRRLKTVCDEVLGIAVSNPLPIAMSMLVFLHFNACSTYYVGRMTDFVGWETLWTGFSKAGLFEAYTWSFFLAVGNLFPMSFKPQTAPEQIVAALYICSGAILYAAFVGYISSAAISINASGRLYNQKMEELIDYVKWKKLDTETRNKLVAYYETKYRGKYFEEDALLSDMNESLREEIACHNTRRLMDKVDFLRREEGDGRDDIYYNKLAITLHARYYIPGDFVMKQGEHGSEMYFILSGRVNVFLNGHKVASLFNDAYFGELALIAKLRRSVTIQVALPTILYMLSQQDFLGVISEFPDMKARIDALAREGVKAVAPNGR
ncbi:hypothetical protein BC830DRAFT_1113701 [Chytriomyces sp. MP71]|nr:hypothetical protein BC830DRAFT_1113701 [Chytriomyces sp. MP71]